MFNFLNFLNKLRLPIIFWTPELVREPAKEAYALGVSASGGKASILYLTHQLNLTNIK